MVTIRRMQEEDTNTVRQVEADAFSAWWKQLRGERAALPLRTRTNVLSCRGEDPEGCFVAEVEGRLVGLIFSRTWGQVGWFGTFSVLPEHQGRGIGKRLIFASLEYLRRADVRVIGLETMPESPYNLGLYLKKGFQTRLLTYLLVKSLDDSTAEGDLPRWSEAGPEERDRWFRDLREVSGRIPPGFDYSKEILYTARHAQGETLVLAEGGRALGMSVIWLQAPREGGEDVRASVQALALHPDHSNQAAFYTLVQASEALARAHDKKLLAIPVNARHAWAVERLLEWGYQVEHAMVRMVLTGSDEEPLRDDLVNCSRWVG